MCNTIEETGALDEQAVRIKVVSNKSIGRSCRFIGRSMLMVTMRTGYYLGQERQLISVNGGREGLGRLLFKIGFDVSTQIL